MAELAWQPRTQGVGSYGLMTKYFMMGAILLENSHASAGWPAANRAIYLPFELESPMTVTTLWWLCGSAAAGNVDCGIYSADGRRLVSTGAIAQTGTFAVQSATVTTTLLGRGVFWLALACSSTSATIFRLATGVASDWLMSGMLQQDSAVPLPTLATFASNTAQYLPCCGFTGRLL